MFSFVTEIKKILSLRPYKIRPHRINITIKNLKTEFRCSFLLALPLMVTECIYGLNGFIANIMIAHLGKEALAANALVFSIFLVIILFFIGLLSSVSIMVSQSVGAKDQGAIAICFKQGFILAVISAFPMMLLIWLAPTILIITGQNALIVAIAKPYFFALMWSMLPVNVFIVIEQFLIGINKTRIVMWMSIGLVPMMLIFDYLFIFGQFGFPKLGVAGLGYAGLTAHLIVSAPVIAYLYYAPSLKAYHLYQNWWHMNRKFLLELINIGIPIGLLFCSDLALFAAIAIMMGILGTETLAAYQIAYQYLMLALPCLFALTQTATVRIGNEAGRNNRRGLKLVASTNMLLSLGIMLIFSIFYIYFPRSAIGIDVDLQAAHLKPMIDIAAKFLPIIGILILSDAVRLINLGSLRGLKDTKFSMYISVFGFWGIAFPSAYIFAFKLHFGGVGIWWGMVLGLSITGLMFLVRFQRLVNRIDLTRLVTKSE